MNTSSITRFTTRSVMKIKKNSPQILFYAGIVGTVATTIMASRATLKAVPVIKALEDERYSIDRTLHNGGYSQKEHTTVVAEQYTVAAVQLTKLYGPVVIVGAASIAALTKSHRQLTSRNTALTVAYTGLFKTFENYRARVKKELGDDIDQQFLHGTVQQEIVDGQNKDGSDKIKSITALDPSSAAAYTHFFDANTPSWVKDPGYNQNMLDGQQDWANVLLQKQGHLFLNQVYDLLHMEHTREGNILGWIFKDLGNNDMFVSFGHNKDGEFIAGYKRDVMLEFNIHGPILDLI